MKIKRFLSLAISICLVFSVCQIVAFAGSWENDSKTSAELGHTSFTKSWEDNGTLKVNGVYYDFTYGFNTFATDEDYIEYVHSQSPTTHLYYGKIKNSNGETAVTNTKTNEEKTNSAQVVHAGNGLTVYVYSRTP